MQPSLDNYVTLCQSYSAFLLGVGGVAITILTLVLTLSRDHSEKDVMPYLVAALLICAATCFVGTHLLNETASLGGTEPMTVRRSGEMPAGSPPGIIRFFWIAEVNIFIASLAFLFALALITLVYSDDGKTELVVNAAFTLFFSTPVFALMWVCNSVTLLGSSQMDLASAASRWAFAVMTFLSYWATGRPGRIRQLPFFVPIAVSIISMWWFGLTAEARRAPDLADMHFLTMGAAIPAGAFAGTAAKLLLLRRDALLLGRSPDKVEVISEANAAASVCPLVPFIEQEKPGFSCEIPDEKRVNETIEQDGAGDGKSRG